MNLGHHPALRDKLAAEYVLGTLRGAARRRFETWLQQDAALRAAVAEWQGRFACMAELGRPAAPPAAAWQAIERRLWPLQRTPWWKFWQAPAARPWAGLAIASSALAIVFGLLLAGRGEAPVTQQVAALTDVQARTGMMVTADASRGWLEVRVAEDVHVPAGRSLQLWAIPQAGKPRSLGVLPDSRSVKLALDQRAIGPDVILLAISLEPKGGSPDPNGPTGPVLYKGSWARL